MSRILRRGVTVASAVVLLSVAVTLGAGAVSRARASAPIAVHARSAASAVRVSWSAPATRSSSKVESYVVTSHPSARTCTTKTLSCSVIGLTKGATYTFTVTAKNRWGASSSSLPSNSVTVVAENGSPIAPISPIR